MYILITMRCIGLTLHGQRCKKRSLRDHVHCHLHTSRDAQPLTRSMSLPGNMRMPFYVPLEHDPCPSPSSSSSSGRLSPLSPVRIYRAIKHHFT